MCNKCELCGTAVYTLELGSSAVLTSATQCKSGNAMHESSLPQPHRRALLGWLSGAGIAATVVGCGGGSSDSESDTVNAPQLSAIALSSGSLSPTFNATTTRYSGSVSNAVSSIDISATATVGTLTINGTAVSSGVAIAVTLSVGSNNVSIVVSNNGQSQTYTLTIVRASEASGGNCALIPNETQGPYPLLAILSNGGLLRADIRSNIGEVSVKTGVPLTIKLTLQNINANCAAISNAAIYI